MFLRRFRVNGKAASAKFRCPFTVYALYSAFLLGVVWLSRGYGHCKRKEAFASAAASSMASQP
jgi:hypothetical protein